MGRGGRSAMGNRFNADSHSKLGDLENEFKRGYKAGVEAVIIAAPCQIDGCQFARIAAERDAAHKAGMEEAAGIAERDFLHGNRDIAEAIRKASEDTNG